MAEPGAAPGQQVETLHRSPGLFMGTVCCRLSGSAPGPEETSVAHQISFPRRGVYVKQVGVERVVADANRVVFYNHAETYRVSHPLPHGDESFVISVGTADLLEMMSHHDPHAQDRARAPFRRTHAVCSPRAFLLQRRLLGALRRGVPSLLGLQEAVVELVDEVLSAPPPPSSSARRLGTVRARRAIVEAAELLLAARSRERLTLREIACAVGSAPFHLARIFHEQSGLPLHRYQSRLRLRAALERLADGEDDLARLACELGFADHSHFTNAFRREFGVPPSRLRQRLGRRGAREIRKILQA